MCKRHEKMKKLTLILIPIITLFLFASCNFNGSKKTDSELLTYKCPMACEGEKTFTHSGSCRVCKMDLKPSTQKTIKKADSVEISDESIFNLTSK